MSRETLLPAMAAHVLENGIAGVSLRPLAKAAGTSDRMLIYHFGNRQGVVDALLEYLAKLYETGLDAALPAEPARDRRETVRRILERTASPALTPFMRLWWEVVAASAAGDETFRESAASTMGLLLGWLEAHMPEGDPDPRGGARLLLTLIEGSQMLGAVGRADIAEAALAAFEG
ncbi:TetR/AcrR family transcriptional regulator [Qipengyuania sphaerica]|uniref:TetR/AcrR family transcriptional regulator n=1 Tax=Qipengyuania sphaerica TaxID=2867243 RepID=UPI001C86A116|nr:TetR/AcrR family transcriptional regulator [Qipengyuania sphaerica]MBX7540274.1 TetR/AcrR family transcriptional regulator [Qipengyuania sphaerica]